jgi:hypothetical protein
MIKFIKISALYFVMMVCLSEFDFNLYQMVGLSVILTFITMFLAEILDELKILNENLKK